jgi:small subunit ribosomal protein S1
LGEGIQAGCKIPAGHSAKENARDGAKLDLGSLSSMLKTHWKGGAGTESKPEAVRPGQVRSFRIAKLDRAAKKIELQLT